MVESHSYVSGDSISTDLEIYLDGSGGKFGKDARLRRCGWGWCQVDRGQIVRGQSGGLQAIHHTVPRAEIQALEYAIRAILA